MGKQEKGLTMVSLVVMLLVIAIISAVTIYYGTGIIRSAKLESLKTDMLLIQAKIRTVEEQANFEGTGNLRGTVLEDTNVLSKLGLTKNDKIKLLSRDDLNDLGLSKVDTEDRNFVVDYANSEVYLVEGFEYKDKAGNQQVKYKLSEIENLSL